jgi:preprotein translocase subunit YajC
MWSDAFAQAAGPAQGAPGAAGSGSANPTMSLLLNALQFLPLFIILYFLLIRPQQQQSKKLEKMRHELKKGDKVLTTGGIIGTVIGVDNGKAVLRVAEDVKLEFATSAIVQIMQDAK